MAGRRDTAVRSLDTEDHTNEITCNRRSDYGALWVSREESRRPLSEGRLGGRGEG